MGRFCTSLFLNGVNGVLADAPGLGKTSVVAAFIVYLMEKWKIPGPFLICCALDNCETWVDMLAWHAPHLRVIEWNKFVSIDVRRTGFGVCSCVLLLLCFVGWAGGSGVGAGPRGPLEVARQIEPYWNMKKSFDVCLTTPNEILKSEAQANTKRTQRAKTRPLLCCVAEPRRRAARRSPLPSRGIEVIKERKWAYFIYDDLDKAPARPRHDRQRFRGFGQVSSPHLCGGSRGVRSGRSLEVEQGIWSEWAEYIGSAFPVRRRLLMASRSMISTIEECWFTLHMLRGRVCNKDGTGDFDREPSTPPPIALTKDFRERG